METHLLGNPFHILGATPRDDRHRLLELAEQRALGSDAEVYLKARADLMNPRRRLLAELDWLPGVPASRAAHLLSTLVLQPMSLRMEEGLPALAHANLLAASWESIGTDHSSADVAAFIFETAALLSRVSAAQALRDINADRAVSGFPIVSNELQLQTELSARLGTIGSVVNAALNRLPAPVLVDAMSAAARRGAENSARSALPFIDDLVDRHYEVGTRAFLEIESATAMALVKAARERACKGEAALGPFLDGIESVVRNWRIVAQPILTSARARGINHGASSDLAHSVHELSIYLHNEHNMYVAMQRLNGLLRECFADLPHLYARLQEDAAFLERISRDFQDRAHKIGLRAEIGTFKKDHLSISPSGIAWNEARYPLDNVSRIRFGGARHSLYSGLGLPSYAVAFGDAHDETQVSLTNQSIYDAFVEKLWLAVGSRLMTAMLTSLKAGQTLHFGDAIIRDDCIELPRRKIFGKREMIRYAWEGIKTWNYDGRCIIAATAASKDRVRLSYRNVHNVAVLSSALASARARPGLRKLSELLVGA